MLLGAFDKDLNDEWPWELKRTIEFVGLCILIWGHLGEVNVIVICKELEKDCKGFSVNKLIELYFFLILLIVYKDFEEFTSLDLYTLLVGVNNMLS